MNIEKIDTAALLRIEDGEQRYEQSSDAFNAYRTRLGAEVKRYLQQEGIPASYLSNLLGLDAGGLSRRFRSLFSVPMDRMTVFAYDFMKKSCHELFFGQPMPTRLPKLLSHVVSIMQEDAAAKKRLCEMAMKLSTEHRLSGTLVTKMDTVDIARERLLEYAGDTFTPAKYVGGTDAPTSVRTGLSNLAEGKKTFLRINTVMYYAMMAGTTLDYFLTVDYTQFTDIALFDTPDQIIRDRAICRFVGRYLSLPNEARAELAKTALLSFWRKNMAA